MPPAAAAIPYVAAAYGGFTAYSGYKQHQAGKRLKKYGREYEAEQIRLADEFAIAQEAIGRQQMEAAHAYAGALGRQAHLMKVAAAETKELARKNADLAIEQGKETLRKTKAEHKQTEGTVTSRLWASGTLANTGSQANFQDALGKENRKQQSWIVKAYKRTAEVIIEGGDIEAALLRAQAVGVSAGAAQALAAGNIAYQEALLAGDTARSQAQFAGDPYIAQGKSMQSAGLGNMIGGLGSIATAGIGAGWFGGGKSAFGHIGYGGGMNPMQRGIPHL